MSVSWNFNEYNLLIDFIIFEELSSQSITLPGLILPSWRVPIFIAPFLKEETSNIPLDEFPKTPSTYFRQDK